MKAKIKMLNVLLIILLVGFAACEGEQGEVGPKGDTGEQGLQGEPGEQGPRGESGDVEALSFGGIELTVSGVRDGEDYTHVIDFKYALRDPYASNWYEAGAEGDKNFTIKREYKFAAKPNAKTLASLDNIISLQFTEVDGDPVFKSLDFAATVIYGNQLAHVSRYVSALDGENNFTISDYSFDAEKGALVFNFTYSYVDYNDETVEINGKVDVVVYKITPA